MRNAGTGLGITRLGQIAIHAHDVERATAFYRDVLGLKFLFAAGQLAFFDCAGVRLMLDKPENPEFVHPSSILYFSVADIQDAHHKLIDAGVEIVAEPNVIAKMPDHDLWMSFFRDTEGNVMALMSEARR
ncbi:MAG TPA: VOC family protein [Candidatus Acidoferrales bacterium]|nr:VOC family protein [Candidatus Acidoferrales bacterium]